MLGGNPVWASRQIRDADLIEVTVPGITPGSLDGVIAVADPELLAGSIYIPGPWIGVGID